MDLAGAPPFASGPSNGVASPAREGDLVIAYHARRGPLPRRIAPTGWLATLAHEQVHALATHVLAHHADRGLRTLAITSALAGEGKTTLALALADRLSEARRRILVIDLDMHRATLSIEAGLDGDAGAMESARRDTSKPVAHVYATDRPNVFVMPVGRLGLDHRRTGRRGVQGAPPHLVPLVDPVRVRLLVQRALAQFDFVILDCPPLLPVADTRVIADIADRVLLVVRAHSTPKLLVEQVIRDLDGGKLFGAVLNHAQPEHVPYFMDIYGYYRRRSTR